ncbi:MAG: dihydroorotate dehydrogenase electron transfer subunit [Fibrobacterota bacterium]
MSKKYNLTAVVVAAARLIPNGAQLTFRAPVIAKSARPGQFVFVKPALLREPVLRRAFSVSAVDRVKGDVSVYFDIKGEGTRALAALKKGDTLAVTGPCGHGFDPHGFGRRNLLVAGGCGIAPMLFLATELKKKGRKVDFYYGARTASQLVYRRELGRLCDTLTLATDDGSAGTRGVITRRLPDSPETPVFACGPRAMLNAFQRLRPDAQVALEAEMACGVGVCMGCAVKMADGSLTRCCVEGPVFRASEVSWN